MKRVLTIAALMAAGTVAHAQFYYQDAKNSEMLRHTESHEPCRKEVILPTQVNGFNVYKADLHSHTIYSDGQVLPIFRIKEAWQDGIDIIAITDHLESRKHEEQLYDYLKGYTDKKYLPKTEGVKSGLLDLNFSVNQAIPEAEKLGLLVIPGTEISRSGATVGHFNALFTKDNNTIYDEDALQSMRNARSQGALIQHNHPGWRRENLQMTEVEKAAYEEGQSKLKGNGKSVPALSVLKTPLRDGDEERPDDEAYRDSYFINANSGTAPGIVDADCNPILDRNEMYSGVKGRASINIYAYNVNGNRGIACGLNNLQKISDGTPLGGKSRAADDFATEDDEDFLN